MQSISNISLAIPCHFDNKLLERFLGLSGNTYNGRQITETYGCLSKSILGHGRSANSVAQVNSIDLVKAPREFADTKRIKFIYLLNAPFNVSKDKSKLLKNHIADILNIVKPHAVVISSDYILRITREINPDIKIYLSTIAGIKYPSDLAPYLKFKLDRVTVHHDLNRDFNALEKLKFYADQNNIELQLLLNESCLYDCKNRKQHYSWLASGSNDDMFQTHCNTIKYSNPVEILASGWIRPEDVSWFNSRFGIKHFKVSGRAKPKKWLFEVIEAYLKGSYHGNLIRLFAITPPWTNEPWEELYLSNKKLEGFLQDLPPQNDESRYVYYQNSTNQLIASGHLKVKKKIMGVGNDRILDQKNQMKGELYANQQN